jgi:hypothetical protein
LNKGSAKPLKEETLSFTFPFFYDLGRAKKERGMKEEGAFSLVQLDNLEGRKPMRAYGPT